MNYGQLLFSEFAELMEKKLHALDAGQPELSVLHETRLELELLGRQIKSHIEIIDRRIIELATSLS